MKAQIMRATVAGGCAVALFAGAVSASAAASTFTVKAGSAAAGTTVTINGASQGASPQIVFKDATTNQTLTCTSSTASGTTKTGTGLAGTKIGFIKSSTWTGCAGPAGLKFTVTQNQTWNLNASTGSSTGASGTISSVKATVNDPGLCSFVVTGAVAAKYTNSSTTLSLSGTTASLTVSSVSGCFGVVNNGDKASFKGSYKLTASKSTQNPITITSP